MKMFPILRSWTSKLETRDYQPPFTSVPFDLVEEHQEQFQSNHSQSPKELASRGGLDPAELAAVLENRMWSPMGLDKAFATIKAMLEVDV